MDTRNLKKLSRTELLELLLAQTKEMERVKAQLAQAQEALQERQLQVEQAGNLAEAVLAVNGVMEAAQASAAQYLENIQALETQARQMTEVTRRRCREAIEQAQTAAAAIRRDAARTDAKLPETDQLLTDIYALLNNG